MANEAPDSGAVPRVERHHRVRRRGWLVLSIAVLVLVSGFAALAVFMEATPQRPSPTGPITLALSHPNLDNHNKAVCAAVTTCNTGGVKSIADVGESAFLFLGFNVSSPPTFSVADIRGNTWHIIAYDLTANLNETVYATYNMATKGNDVWYVNATSSATYSFTVVVIGGVAANPIDNIGTANQGNHATAYNAVTTLAATSDLVIAGDEMGGADTSTAGSGATLIDSQSGTVSSGSFDATSASTGSFTVNMVGGTARNWEAIAISLSLGATPPAPTGVGVSSETHTGITWGWTPVTGAVVNQTAYHALYSAGSCGAYTGVNVATGTNTYNQAGLTANEGACFSVSDWNSSGQGTISIPIIAWSGSAPGPPTGLAGNAVSTTSVTLTWTNPTCSPAASCSLVNNTVEYGTTCTPSTFVSLGAAGTTKTITGLTSGTDECYAVVAWNVSDTSTRSSTITLASGPAKTPTALTLGTITKTTADLTWTQPADTGTLLNSTIYIWAGASCSGATYAQQNVASSAGAGTATGLLTGGQYCVEVTTWNAVGQSPKSSPVVFTTAEVPAAPTAVTHGATTLTTIALSWTNPAGGGLLNDTVYWKVGYLSCGGGMTAHSIGSAGTSYTIPGLTTGTVYSIEITTWNVTGQSADSTCVSAETALVPAAPSAFSIAGTSDTTMTLAWTLPPGGGLLNITVYYVAAGSCGASMTAITLGSTPSGYVVVALAPATTYSVEITAWNATGQSPDSSCATGETTPAAPTGLTATTVSSVRINLAWTNPTGTLNDNHVYVFAGASCMGSPTGHDLGSVLASYGVTGLAPATVYSFDVTASDSGGGEGIASACMTNTTYDPIPAAPTGLMLTTVSATEIDLSWTNPGGGGLTDDHVYVWDASCSVPVTSYDLGSAQTSYHDTALSGATTYAFDVTASTISGEGPASTCPQGTTLPAAASGLTVVPLTDASVRMSWTNPSGTLTQTEAYAYPTVGCTGSPSSDATGLTANGAVAYTYSNSLSAHTTYYFDVVPSSVGGPAASASNCFAATTDYAPPGAPTGLAVTQIGQTTAFLNWTQPSGTLVGDNITLYTAGCAVEIDFGVFGAIQNYTLIGLTPGTSYCVTVNASTDGGAGPNAVPYANFTTTFPTGAGGGGFGVGGGIASLLAPALAIAFVFIVFAVVVGAWGRRYDRK